MKASSTRDRVAARAGLLASRVPGRAITVLAVAATGVVSNVRTDASLILLGLQLTCQPGHSLHAATQSDASPMARPRRSSRRRRAPPRRP